MKYLEIYEAFKTLDSLTDEQLAEKLEWLRVEYKDIQDEISEVVKIINYRKETLAERYAETLPDRIFDFNKKQLDWIFYHGHDITTKRYEISSTYYYQLTGVNQNGFTPETNQSSFSVNTYSILSESENTYVSNPHAIKSVKFLGDNLKKVEGGFVKFGISYQFGDEYTHYIRYYSDTNMTYVFGRGVEYDSIDELLKAIALEDIDSKNEI